MRFIRTFAAVLVCLVLTQRALAAAQLKAGATTSAQPTSANPQLRQIQMTFDPDVSPAPSITPCDTPYSLTSFQLSISYDLSLVTLEDIQFVDPYTQNPQGEPQVAHPSLSPASYYLNNTDTGIVNYISGQASANQVPAGQDVNIFTADFVLNQGVSFNTPLTFTIFGDPNAGDFMTGTNPNDPQDQITSSAADIVPTTYTGTFTEATTSANPAPLPSGALAGLLTLALLAAGTAIRRGMRSAVMS